jgi:hypothetical protein
MSNGNGDLLKEIRISVNYYVAKEHEVPAALGSRAVAILGAAFDDLIDNGTIDIQLSEHLVIEEHLEEEESTS